MGHEFLIGQGTAQPIDQVFHYAWNGKVTGEKIQMASTARTASRAPAQLAGLVFPNLGSSLECPCSPSKYRCVSFQKAFCFLSHLRLKILDEEIRR